MLNVPEPDAPAANEAVRFLKDRLNETISYVSRRSHVWEHSYPVEYLHALNEPFDEGRQAGVKRLSEFVLYVHVPFCTQKCDFCAFFRPGDVAGFGSKAYVDCLKAELKNSLPVEDGAKILSIYFGGGTPTLLDPDDFRELMRFIRANFPLAEDADVSVETEPQYVGDEMAAAFVEGGVTEAIFGVQSFNEEILRSVNRRNQSNSHVYESIRRLRSASGIRIAFDLIYGLGGPESAETFLKDNLGHIAALRPDTVVVHPLQNYRKFPEMLGNLPQTELRRIYEAIGGIAPPASSGGYHSQYYACRWVQLKDVLAIGLGGETAFWQDGRCVQREGRYNAANDFAGYREDSLSGRLAFDYRSYPSAEALRWYIVWNLHNSYGVREDVVERTFPRDLALFRRIIGGIQDVVEHADGKFNLKRGYERVLPFKTGNDEINYFIFSFCRLYSASVQERFVAHLRANLPSKT